MGVFRKMAWRAFRSVRRIMGSANSHFVHHPGHEDAFPWIPVDPMRGQRVMEFLYDNGLAEASILTRPQPASFEQISRVHSAD